jgi:hypothetical protein
VRKQKLKEMLRIKQLEEEKQQREENERRLKELAAK